MTQSVMCGWRTRLCGLNLCIAQGAAKAPTQSLRMKMDKPMIIHTPWRMPAITGTSIAHISSPEGAFQKMPF